MSALPIELLKRIFGPAVAVLAVVILWTGEIPAQLTFHLHPAHSENRLSENATRDLIQDKRGLLWIATIDGLNRYDGYRFQAYRYRADDSTGISDNYVSTLYEDAAGTLWVGTYHGLNRYLPSCDCFENYLEGYERNGAPGTLVTDMTEDADGNFWVAAYNGLSYRRPGSNTFIPLLVNARGLRESSVTALQPATGGGIWIGYGEQGISHYRHGKWKHYFTKNDLSEVKGLTEVGPGMLLVAARKGAYLADTRLGTIRKLRDGQFAGISKIGDKLVVRSFFGGVHEWVAADSSLRKVPVYYRGERISGDIHIYLEDKKGTVWGARQGLVKQDPYEQRFHRISPQGKDDNDLLPSPEVVGIKGDSLGNLAIATQYTGILELSGPPGSWQGKQSPADAFNHTVFSRFPYLEDEVAWINGIDELYRYDLRTHRARRYAAGKDIKTIFRDSRGREWYVDKVSGIGRWTGTFPLEPPYNNFGSDTPIDITERDGKLWVLASEYLYRYEEAVDRFERVARVTPEIRRDEQHRHFTIDRRGNVWIGSVEALYRYSFATDTFIEYTERSGIANAKVSSIIETVDGIWLGTNEGISYFDYATESFQNFDTNDGLINTIHLPEAAYRSPDGFLYFGGINGIDYFHPDSVAKTDPFPPIPVLERITPHSPMLGYPNKILWPDPDASEPIRLSYKSLPLQFDLLALGYTQPTENRYAFILEGADDNWNYVGSNRSTIYSSLPRGEDLAFRIKVASHDGVWSEPVAYHLYIVPPFWETIYFRLALLALGILALIAGYRFRVRQIRRHNRFLEAEVARKTQQVAKQAERLSTANADLRHQASVIQSKARQLTQLNIAQSSLFTNLSHEFRTLLTLLVGYLEELVSADDPATVLPTVLDHMRLNSAEMLRLVDQLMDTARLESGQYPLYITPGNLREEAKNIVHSFHILAEKSRVKLEMNYADDLPESVWYDRDVVYKVLSNLLSNALKFTPAGGVVTVRIIVLDDHMQLAVSDTGLGIPEAEIPRIFDRFHQVKQANGQFNGTGIGLALVKKLVKRHQGRIRVTSEPGDGTVFTVDFPLNPSVYSSEDIQPPREAAYYLPQRAGANTVLEDSPSRDMSGSAAPPASDLQILVVEDNAQARALLCRQLRADYTVFEAGNGDEGLSEALKIVPDLIITDRLMPTKDGIELCRDIRADARTSHIPIIMLTAMTTREQKIEGLTSGADLYLHKPFDRKEFALLVGKQFERRDRMKKRFLQNFSSDHLPEGLNQSDEDFLRQLTDFVSDHLEADIDLSELGRSLGVSRTQLFRKMKALLGMSVTEYIRDYRLRRAFELLQSRDYRIGEVIQMTGFNSRSYFYRSFKTKFGCRPTEVKDSDQVEKSEAP
ncbi:ATP-binding protein [Lewinella sp. IMCC34191]|uniref:hybrid sensor histidine kinase/response regulator transcription factor n=1 Tax=Lewinella sp. IMCC34191 TaxID=2259172 RepID=UPI000E2625BA|nr:ATP-binding protein [Lewinella sp. IMCC34191]